MTYYDWTKLFLDFGQAIAWPLFAAFAVLTFRRPVREMAERVTRGKLSTDGVELELAGRSKANLGEMDVDQPN